MDGFMSAWVLSFYVLYVYTTLLEMKPSLFLLLMWVNYLFFCSCQATESFGRLLQDVVGNESRAIAIKTAADHSKLRTAGGGKSMLPALHTPGA